MSHWHESRIESLLFNLTSNNPTLSHINLTNESLYTSHISILCQSLLHNTTVTNLNLTSNFIIDTIAISRYMKVTTSLTYLNLGCNEITGEGSKSLFQALGYNKTLKSLNLDHNPIEIEGARYLAECLRVNETLQILHLEGTKLESPGIIELANSMIHNESLKTLDLMGNTVEEEVYDKWNKCLEKNKTIEILQIEVPVKDEKKRVYKNILKKIYWNRRGGVTIGGLQSLEKEYQEWIFFILWLGMEWGVNMRVWWIVLRMMRVEYLSTAYRIEYKS